MIIQAYSILRLLEILVTLITDDSATTIKAYSLKSNIFTMQTQAEPKECDKLHIEKERKREILINYFLIKQSALKFSPYSIGFDLKSERICISNK